MDLQQQIQHWFKENGHFALGLQLLSMTGAQPALVSRLQGYLKGTWVPDAAKQSLRVALQTYLQSAVRSPQLAVRTQNVANPVIPPRQMPEFPTSPQFPNSPIPQFPNPAPPAILALREEARLLHKRHADLKGRLNLMVDDAANYTDEDRAAVAAEIMLEVIPALDGIYASIRTWKQTGQAPKPPNEREIVADTVEKMNRLQKILPPRISKLKKYLREKKRAGKTLTPDELTAYEKELLDKETEKARIEQELGLC